VQYKLSKREVEIMQFLVQGKSREEIADYLSISRWTVNSHVVRIYEKLNVHRMIDAVVRLYRDGVL